MANKVKNTSKFDVKKSIDTIKSTTKEVNTLVLETTETLIDTAIVRSGQWQKLSEKAIKGGLKLASNQQDLMFTTLETLKAQLMTGSKRFKSMMN